MGSDKHYTLSSTQQQVQRAPSTVHSAHPYSRGSESSNVASQQFELSKDTFRWTFEWAEIDFNRLKILIFPVNNQETFPVGGQANQSLWEEVRVVQSGGFDAVHSPLHCFLLPSLHLGQMEAKLKLNPLCLWDSRPLPRDHSESPLPLSKNFRVESNFYYKRPEWPN